MRTGSAALACAAALALPALAPRLHEAPPCAAPSAGADPGQVRCSVGPGLRGPARLLFGLRLDANRAEPASLEALPGVGPARAAAIVAERCRRPFASPADLERVRGIGPHTRAGLEAWLAVEPGRPARCAPLP
jgi:competence protein ComEA